MDKDYKYGEGERNEITFLINKRYFRILEIGCGYGEFRKQFIDFNEYWGIDEDVNVFQRATINLDKFICKSFDAAFDDLPDNYFDLIVCNDVIEHMQDEDVFLKKIKQKMTKESNIIGSIPNVRYVTNLVKLIFYKDWKYVDTGILDKTHLRFFTKKSLIRLFESNGFKIRTIKGINPVKFNSRSLKEILKFIGLVILCLFFGNDSRYIQFGFLIENKS